jgi:hypothetical protein
MHLFLILLQAAIAIITSPAPGDTVAGTTSLRGTAASPAFARYEIAFAYDPNPTDTWFEIQPPSTLPVIDSTLAEWDTRLIADGEYMIRLRVFSSGSNTPVETIVRGIQVRNTAPTESASTPSTDPAATGVLTPTGAGPQPTHTGVQPTHTSVQANVPSLPAPTAPVVGSSTPTPAPVAPLLDLSTYSSAFCNGVVLSFFGFILLGTYVALRDRIRRLVRRWIRRVMSDIRKP